MALSISTDGAVTHMQTYAYVSIPEFDLSLSVPFKLGRITFQYHQIEFAYSLLFLCRLNLLIKYFLAHIITLFALQYF